jgi:HAD superfamily hydrolase (TIGR01490 family)
MTTVGAAFFDLDKTVIAKASIAAFGRPFRRGGLLRRRTVARIVTSHLIFLHLGADEQRLARIREAMLLITKGWEQEQVRDIVRETMLETIEPLIYAEALELMEAHRAKGDRIYLVSAAPEEIVLPLAEMLGADGAVASRGEIDDTGRYTGHMAFYASGQAKADALAALAQRSGIDLAAASAYSDSATDLPMLEAVGHPVVVNADRSLARIARERGWESVRFTKPVRLRDRVSVSAPIITTSVAALAGAIVLLWRHGHRSRQTSSPL